MTFSLFLVKFIQIFAFFLKIFFFHSNLGNLSLNFWEWNRLLKFQLVFTMVFSLFSLSLVDNGEMCLMCKSYDGHK